MRLSIAESHWHQEYRTEQGIPKVVPKYECPQRGSRVLVHGLEDLRDDRWNGERGTIQGERNGRWVVRHVLSSFLRVISNAVILAARLAWPF
jgi:hypothetical protein